LRAGDPDVPSEVLMTAVAQAEAQRRELEERAAKKSKVILLPKRLEDAAERIRAQLDDGLSGCPRAAARARAVLREAFGGKVSIEEKAGKVFARWSDLGPAALLRAAGGEGSSGSGGRI
jgi:hypothetical protein